MRKHPLWAGFVAAIPLAAAVFVAMWALTALMAGVGPDPGPEPLPTSEAHP